MSARSIPLHLGLLILTLVTAWITFRGQLQGDSPSEETGVVVLQAALGDVERVVYETQRRTLRLEARRDEGEMNRIEVTVELKDPSGRYSFKPHDDSRCFRPIGIDTLDLKPVVA